MIQSKNTAAGLIIIACVVSVGGILALRGIAVLSAHGTCYKRTVVCYGVPVGECIGVETEKMTFDKQDTCQALDNITDRCNTARGLICQEENVSGMEWTSSAAAFGVACRVWQEQYTISLHRCGE